MALPTFIDSDLQYRGWYRYKDAEAYLQRAHYILPEHGRELRVLLRLGNITRRSRHENVEYDPNHTSTGFLNEFMTLLEQKACGMAEGVYVENVFNEWLPGWLMRRGYTKTGKQVPYCFYRLNP